MRQEHSHQKLLARTLPAWLGVLLAACGPPAESLAIDPALRPGTDALPGPRGALRPLCACADEGGVVSDFVAGELLLTTDRAGELDALLARTGGKLLSKNEIPPPPRRPLP